MSKVYLASSWKNAALLRGLEVRLEDQGFEVDNFSGGKENRFAFNYKSIPNYDYKNAVDMLQESVVIQAFKEDKKWIDWADWVLLVLPSGRSSHLKAGYAVGSGKKLAIYAHKFPVGEFDTMYGFADVIGSSFSEVMYLMQQKDAAPKVPKLAASEVLDLWIKEQQASGMSNKDIASYAFTHKGSVLSLTISNARKGTFNLLTQVGSVDLADWYRRRETAADGPDNQDS